MKILVVDDEHDIRKLFEQSFRREIRSGQLQFVFAYSGEEAMRFLQVHHSEVVLILSDINMPGMSGLELLRHIRQDFPAPPPPTVLMITAYGDQATRTEALHLGANDLISKPVDFSALKRKFAELQTSGYEN